MDTHKVGTVSLACCFLAALTVWALPASARATSKTTTKATIVNVIAGKPSEFAFTLSTKTVKHGTVTFKLTDKGYLPHDLKLCTKPNAGKATANTCTGKLTPTISPGGSASLTVTFAKAGSYEYLCTVAGHAAYGMKGELKVT